MLARCMHVASDRYVLEESGQLSWWDGYPLWCALPASTGLESVCRNCTGWLKTPENVPYFLPHCLLLPKLWLMKEVAAPKNVYVGGGSSESILMINVSDLD